MLKAASLVSLVLILSACGSAGNSASDVTPSGLIPPEVEIRQIGGVGGAAARNITGPIAIQLQATVLNQSSEALTLERIEVQSLGAGAYTVQPTTRPFRDAIIASGATQSYEFFVSGTAEDTVMGVNGPVTMRVTAYFNSSLGRFRKIYVQQVNDQLSRPRSPR